jgi:alkylation response protein AidB-like acyl-CoA dehydrogenase
MSELTIRRRLGYTEDHEAFRHLVRAFIAKEVSPHVERWEETGVVDRRLFTAAGAAGLLAFNAPEELGGGGAPDFWYNVVISEEACRAGASASMGALSLENDICLPYLLDSGTLAQQEQWVPRIASGEVVIAIAMTEPTAGSDLASMHSSAVLDDNGYVINGAKTFISSAQNCDLVIVACKTDTTKRHEGISLFLVEADRFGFERGSPLRKIGQHSADTGELFFDDLRVPVANMLGAPGQGFRCLMRNLARERISISVVALAQAERAFDLTLAYARERVAFGKPIGSFQNTRFVLAEMRTELDMARIFVDTQVCSLNEGNLSAETAAEAKWWTTELAKRVVDQCLQVFGGYGYMEEYPIARLWRDVRVMTIYGGTTEIMKEIVGRGLGL